MVLHRGNTIRPTGTSLGWSTNYLNKNWIIFTKAAQLNSTKYTQLFGFPGKASKTINRGLISINSDSFLVLPHINKANGICQLYITQSKCNDTII